MAAPVRLIFEVLNSAAIARIREVTGEFKVQQKGVAEVSATATASAAEMVSGEAKKVAGIRETIVALKAQQGTYSKGTEEWLASNRLRIRSELKLQESLHATTASAAAASRASRGDTVGRVGGRLPGGAGLRAFTGVGPGVALGVVGAVIGAKSVGAAKDFQAQMELIQTQAGASTKEVEHMTDAVKKMSVGVGAGPEALAKALYHVESSGFRGAKALDVLRMAARGAAIGHADLEAVTNALVGAQHSGIKGSESMAKTMGTLNAIVGAGNMRMEDLAAAIGTGILPSAKNFGLSLTDVGAALATMTRNGVPAIDAATRLRMTFSLLAAPTSKAREQLGKIGIDADDMANMMRKPGGLLKALELLKGHLDDSGLSATHQAQLLSAAFGGGRSSSAILTVLGNLKDVNETQNSINKGTSSFGRNWKETQQTSEFATKRFHAAVKVLGVEIGTALLPKVTETSNRLATWIDRMNKSGKLQADLKEIVKQLGAAFHTLGEVLHVVRQAFDAVHPVAQKLIGLVGGTTNAVKLLLTAMVAAKVYAFASALTAVGTQAGIVSPALNGMRTGVAGVGTQAGIASGKVAALKLALKGLVAVGLITILITVLLNKKALDDAGSQMDRWIDKHLMSIPGYDKSWFHKKTSAGQLFGDDPSAAPKLPGSVGGGAPPSTYAQAQRAHTQPTAGLTELNTRLPGAKGTPAIGYSGHSKKSYHYSGEALDIGDGGNPANLVSDWNYLFPMRENFAELIWAPPDDVARKAPGAPGGYFWGTPGGYTDHKDHIHVAFTGTVADLKRILGQRFSQGAADPGGAGGAERGSPNRPQPTPKAKPKDTTPGDRTEDTPAAKARAAAAARTKKLVDAPSGKPLYGQACVNYIASRCAQLGLDPDAVLAVASVEGGFNGRMGDNKSSFGPFQLHHPGELPVAVWDKGIIYAQAWANTPAGLDYALKAIAKVAGGATGKGAVNLIVTQFENPANEPAEVAKASGRLGKTPYKIDPRALQGQAMTGATAATATGVRGAIQKTIDLFRNLKPNIREHLDGAVADAVEHLRKLRDSITIGMTPAQLAKTKLAIDRWKKVVTDGIKAATEEAKGLITIAEHTLERAWSNLQRLANRGLDRQRAPARKALGDSFGETSYEKTIREHDEKRAQADRDRNLAAAQKQFAEATTPEEAAAGQQAIDDAMFAQWEFDNAKEGEAQAAARDQAKQDALDDFDAQSEDIKAAFNDRLALIKDKLAHGVISQRQALKETKALFTEYKLPTEDAAGELANAMTTAIVTAIETLTTAINKWLTAIGLIPGIVDSVKGVTKTVDGWSVDTSKPTKGKDGWSVDNGRDGWGLANPTVPDAGPTGYKPQDQPVAVTINVPVTVQGGIVGGDLSQVGEQIAEDVRNALLKTSQRNRGQLGLA